MTKAILVIAALVDLALAALMIAVSGFLFGGGPESGHAGSLALAAYIAAVIGCVAAPIVGIILNKRGKAGAGIIVAWLPPLGALVAMAIPAPY